MATRLAKGRKLGKAPLDVENLSGRPKGPRPGLPPERIGEPFILILEWLGKPADTARGLVVLADKGYIGTGEHVHALYRGRNKPARGAPPRPMARPLPRTRWALP